MSDRIDANVAAVRDSLSADLFDIKADIANMLAGIQNIITTVRQAHQLGSSAHSIATEARAAASRPPVVVTEGAEYYATTAASAQTTRGDDRDVSMRSEDGHALPCLCKMDVKPPLFEGVIDGIKLSSFIFQFETKYQQKGYDLQAYDHLLCAEMNQSVCKNSLV